MMYLASVMSSTAIVGGNPVPQKPPHLILRVPHRKQRRSELHGLNLKGAAG